MLNDDLFSADTPPANESDWTTRRDVWRVTEIARELGVTRKAAPETDRLATIRARNARYTYRCIGCAGEWTRRSPFGRARLCASCEGKGRPSRLILVRRPRRQARRKA